MNRTLCLCDQIKKINTKTKICLVIHAKELKRTTNTGRLAIHALVNSEMRIRGATTETLDLSDLISPAYRTLLFYPSKDSFELTPQFVQMDARPIILIVPDGNWRQASKVHYRHHELKDIVRVKITTPNLNPYHIRAESTEYGMATLEAIAHALKIIEGKEAGDKIMRFFQDKLEATLRGRGISIE